MSLPYDGVDPGVEVREESEGDEAGDDEPGHVDVPHDVRGIEPEIRRFDRLRARVDVLLEERDGIRFACLSLLVNAAGHKVDGAVPLPCSSR